MAVLSFRTSNYAQNIYLFGQNRLTERDGFAGVPAEYYGPVQQFAADKYYIEQIDNALAQGWINQQEYDETLAKKGPEDPRYRQLETTPPA